MPHLARFLLRHASIGFGAAIATVAAIMWLDMAGLRTLMFNSDTPFLALFILTFFMGLTFGSVQMGIAIMSEADPTGGKSPDAYQRLNTLDLEDRTGDRRSLAETPSRLLRARR